MKEKIQTAAKFLILFTAIAFIAIGLLRNEQAVVLKKAVKICLECIGIG